MVEYQVVQRLPNGSKLYFTARWPDHWSPNESDAAHCCQEWAISYAKDAAKCYGANPANPISVEIVYKELASV
jgi:hypothetical protein